MAYPFKSIVKLSAPTIIAEVLEPEQFISPDSVRLLVIVVPQGGFCPFNSKESIKKTSKYTNKQKERNFSVEEKIVRNEDSGTENTNEKQDYFVKKEKKKEIRKKYNYYKKRVEEIEKKLQNLETRKNELENEMIKEDFYKNIQNSITVKKEYENILFELDDYQTKWESESKLMLEIEKSINIKI